MQNYRIQKSFSWNVQSVKYNLCWLNTVGNQGLVLKCENKKNCSFNLPKKRVVTNDCRNRSSLGKVYTSQDKKDSRHYTDADQHGLVFQLKTVDLKNFCKNHQTKLPWRVKIIQIMYLEREYMNCYNASWYQNKTYLKIFIVCKRALVWSTLFPIIFHVC